MTHPSHPHRLQLFMNKSPQNALASVQYVQQGLQVLPTRQSSLTLSHVVDIINLISHIFYGAVLPPPLMVFS